MLGRRQKLKYEIVENAVDEDIVEVGKIRRKVLTKQCVWSSACTVLLITLYFIPSIGLTFYQRWVYNVSIISANSEEFLLPMYVFFFCL